MKLDELGGGERLGAGGRLDARAGEAFRIVNARPDRCWTGRRVVRKSARLWYNRAGARVRRGLTPGCAGLTLPSV